MVLVTHGISSRRHVLLKSQSVTAPTLMLKHIVSTISAPDKNSTVMFTLRKNRDVRLPPVARELSLLSSVITYDGLSVAREWLGLAVGPGRAPKGALDVHRTSAVT